MPLGHVPEAREVAEVRARHTEDVDLSGEKVSEPEQPFGDCRFPGAVGAQDEDDLTGGDGEVDICLLYTSSVYKRQAHQPPEAQDVAR